MLGAATAQTPPPAPSSEAAAKIMEAAKSAGVPVVIIGAAPPPAAAPLSQPPFAERAAGWSRRVLAEARQSIAEVKALPETLPPILEGLSGRSDPGWLWPALVIAFIAGLGGLVVERLAAARLERLLIHNAPELSSNRGARIRYALSRAALRAVAIAVGLGSGFFVAAIAVDDLPGHESVVLSVFETFVVMRLALLFLRFMLSPDDPATRVFAIPDAVSKRVYRRVMIGVGAIGLVVMLATWLERIGAPVGAVNAVASLSTVLGAGLFGQAAWTLRYRRARGESGPRAPWISRNWHLLFIGYTIAAVAATILGRLSGAEVGGLLLAPVVAGIIAGIIYAVALLAIDRLFPPPLAGETASSFRAWAERSALVIVGAIALAVVLGEWEVDIFSDAGEMRPAFTVLIISVGAWIGWDAIRTAFDQRIAEERGLGGQAAEEREDGDEGGAGGTRLETILPLFRNAILIAILVIVAMVGLSSIGVDIAPLFAGAGLVGIAIGFGAQTLVRDIFSGVFFLIDDAFRIGEYIDTGGAKGTVERISIRSMQLRHHTGPLHTIPFGEVKQLTNFSRDWVIMKLPIRVRFGTDTERVRKLVKKLGQQLLEDPVIGTKFVEPLKSQGVYQMDEYGIITRVKFKTRPGDQFAVRKVVYQKINELFEHEGIAFGGREVVVRAADEPHGTEGVSADALTKAAAAEAGSTPSARA